MSKKFSDVEVEVMEMVKLLEHYEMGFEDGLSWYDNLSKAEKQKLYSEDISNLKLENIYDGDIEDRYPNLTEEQLAEIERGVRNAVMSRVIIGK